MPRFEEPGPSDSGQQGNPFKRMDLDEEHVRGATPPEASGREPHRLRNTLLTLLIPVTALGATVAVMAWKGNPKEKLRAQSSALPSVGAATATPTKAPPSVSPETATVDRPWAGSPAEAWPAGPDGLALPQATAVGVFDQDRVAKDLELAKAFLVATNLDPKVVAGGYPQAALDLTNQQNGDDLAADLAHPSKENDPATWVSRFDPEWAVPVTDQVKVQGLITFEGDGEQGLLVHVDVTFVYALKPGPQVGKAAPSTGPTTPGGGSRPSGGSSSSGAKSVALIQAEPGTVEVEREIVRRKLDIRFADPARFQVKKDKVSLTRWSTERANTLCGFHDGYLRPSFRADRSSGTAAPSGGPATDPYDWSRPLDESGECGTASRS
ncbi:hypothetical protein [Kitasatospora sp. CB01950]|uniref:hypothetical protein n=1 Tax=Kitasatospora sp. CB01950 TaxID=1703930 RepID=UPI0011613350|nr:hypothetical protein [Kitasatospora sp. CB01950]